jgi:hypothetical protein
MKLLAQAGTVTHADFYSAVAAVYSLIFISINVLLLAGNKYSERGPGGHTDLWIWLGQAFGVTVSVAIPLAILASFFQDTDRWRQLAFIGLVGELALAVLVAGINLETPTSKASAGSGR